MRRRWWWLLTTAPAGFAVGRLLGELGFTPWKVALGAGLLTGLIVGWLLVRDRRWFRRQADEVERALKEDRL